MKRVMPAVGLAMFLLLVPILLYSLLGPPSLPNIRLSDIGETLSGPFLSPDSVIRALGLLVWALWMYLAVVCVLRVIAVIGIQRGSPSGRRLLAATSRMAPGVLLMAVDLALGTVLLLGPVSSGKVEASAPVQSSPPVVSSAPVNGAKPQVLMDRSYVVRPGDSLWRIAERELGSGDRWPEIFALNQGRNFPDGRTFTNPRLIRPNWILSLPAFEAQPLPSAPAASPPNAAAEPSPVVSPLHPGPSRTFAPEAEPPGPGAVEVASPKAVVRLPSGAALAASFASGVLASHALASLRKRRRYRPSQGLQAESSVEPALVLDLRRAQVAPAPSRLDSAIFELVSFWKGAAGRSPSILSAMESEDRVVFLIDGDDIPLESTQRIRISRADGYAKAEIRKPFLPIDERPSPIEGSLIPVGATGSSTLHLGLLGSGGASVIGDERSRFAAQLILSSVVDRTPDQIEVVLLGDLDSFGRLIELPHVKASANWSEAESVLQNLQVELLARARAFEARDAEDIQRYVATNDAQPMPAILVVCSGPPMGMEALLAGMASQLSRFGGAVVGIDWTFAGSKATLTAGGEVVLEAKFPLERDRLQSLVPDDESVDELLEIVQEAYGPSPLLDNSLPQVIDITDRAPQAVDHQLPAAPSTPVTLADAEVSEVPVDQANVATVRSFGPMTVSRRGRVIRKGWRMRSKELLAYLIAHPQGVPKDEIVRIFWPDVDPRRAERLLRDSIFRLRDLFVSPDEKWIEGWVYREENVIVLEKERWDVDVWRFERLVTTARDLAEEEAAPRLWEALSIYRGDFCENDDYPWVEGSRERYRRLLVTAAAQLAERLDASGDKDEAIRVLDRALGFVPLCEDLHRRVISLEARAGRNNDAEVRYQQLISKLADELGEDPEPDTLNLIQQIRRGRQSVS